MRYILNDRAKVIEILKECTLTDSQIHIILLALYNFYPNITKINLSEIARTVGTSREAVRQLFDSAIKKILESKSSEYFFGSDKNPQLARRKRKIAIYILNTPYTSEFPDFYSFFKPFYTELEVKTVEQKLDKKFKILISDLNNLSMTRDSYQYKYPKKEFFFRIIEKVFEFLINEYGWRNLEGYNEQIPNNAINPNLSNCNPPEDSDKKNISSKYICQQEDKTNSGYKCKGIYTSAETRGYLRWQIDDILKEMNKEEIIMLHKAYGPYFICPTSANSRDIKMTSHDYLAVMRIKNKIRTSLRRWQRRTQPQSSFSLEYDDYINIVEYIKNNFSVEKDINSEAAQNNMIVFLYLGIGEAKPMSIGTIAQIYNKKQDEIRTIILNFLKSFKTKLEIEPSLKILITKTEGLQAISEQELSIWPKIPKTPKRKKRIK